MSTAGSDDECIFCAAEELVVHRGERAFVLLNAFPYNTGHLMVAPSRHAADLTELSPQETADLWGLVTTAVQVLRDAMNPDGFNIGANIGAAAGAGIPDHVHVHVVPRWGGDTNFMTTVGDTKVLPEMLVDTAAKLRPLFAR